MYIIYSNNPERVLVNYYAPFNRDFNYNLKIKISNSYFEKNNAMFYSNFGNIEIDNCNYLFNFFSIILY